MYVVFDAWLIRQKNVYREKLAPFDGIDRKDQPCMCKTGLSSAALSGQGTTVLQGEKQPWKIEVGLPYGALRLKLPIQGAFCRGYQLYAVNWYANHPRCTRYRSTSEGYMEWTVRSSGPQ